MIGQTETAALKKVGDNKSGPFERKLTELYTAATYVSASNLKQVNEPFNDIDLSTRWTLWTIPTMNREPHRRPLPALLNRWSALALATKRSSLGWCVQDWFLTEGVLFTQVSRCL